MTDTLLVGVSLIGVGIWLLWEAFQFYSCHLRSKAHIYLIEGASLDYQALSYGFGPIGIGAICVGVSMALPLSSDTSQFIFYGSAPFFIIGFGLTIWQPHWLTPSWLRWIEEYNYDIRSLLGEKARQTPDWTQRIGSQADLEAWVAEVRQKHYKPQPLDSYTEAMQRAGLKPRSRSLWGIALVVIAVASGLGQLLFGNAFIGFIIGGGVVLSIYLIQPRE